MTAEHAPPGALIDRIRDTVPAGRRKIVAIAGAPGSGKSTVAAALAEALNRRGGDTCVVPMDGFHLDNRILSARGLIDRKGAPETFDAAGFARLLDAIAQDAQTYYPLFDRARDIAIAGAGVVHPGCDTVLVEGNYLLLDAPEWRGLARHWDLSVFLDVDEDELRRRLVARWTDHGLPADVATERAEQNDLPNARTVVNNLIVPDIRYPGTESP